MQKPGIFGNLEYSGPFHNCIPTPNQNPCIFTKIGRPCVILEIQNPGMLAILGSWNIQNTDIFKTRQIFGTCQRFEMEYFAKIFKNHNCFSKELYLRSLTGFWIRLSLNKHSLICRVTLRFVLVTFRNLP